MIRLQVKADVKGVLRQLQRQSEQIRGRAVAAAINKTADKARAEMTRAIRDEFVIKAGDVRSQVKVSQRATAKGSRLEAVLEAFGRRRGHSSRNVMLFAARQTKRGVTVHIKRGGGRKLIRSAWIGNQGRTVFERVPGAKRLPIRGVETIDLPQMFNTRRINQRVVRKIGLDFQVEMQRAIANVLRQS